MLYPTMCMCLNLGLWTGGGGGGGGVVSRDFNQPVHGSSLSIGWQVCMYKMAALHDLTADLLPQI